MSKRNLVLLIIVLVIISGFAVFYFSSIKQNGLNQTGGSDTNFFSDFFPFGNNKNNTQVNIETPTDVSGYIPTNSDEVSTSKLKKISSLSVAGYTVFMKERFKEIPTPSTTINETASPITKSNAPLTEFTPALKYVERATGNIYQTFADKIDERKITTNIIPQVYEAYFGNKGESVVMRYLKGNTNTIESFVGALPKDILGGDTTENTEIVGSFLPENISDLSISGDTQKMFYLFNSSNSVSGITADYLGDNKTQIFTSPFTEWLSLYPNSQTVTLTTKPSSNVPGYMYLLNPSKKNFVKVLGGINGLTTLTSPNGNLIAYSDNKLSFKIYDISKSETISTGVKTLPEKCVWNNTNTYIYCAVPQFSATENLPDSWYQGETSFDDQIWTIDALTGNAIQTADLIKLSNGEMIDAVKLSVDEGENFLFLINKKNSSLWELSLRQ